MVTGDDVRRKTLSLVICSFLALEFVCADVQDHKARLTTFPENAKPVHVGTPTRSLEALLLWAVEVHSNGDKVEEKEDIEIANDIADELGLYNVGRVGELPGHFTFSYKPEALKSSMAPNNERHSIPYLHSIHKRYVLESDYDVIAQFVEDQLSRHSAVAWFDRQVVKSRQKRSMVDLRDPQFPSQWHLVNHVEKEMDINVTGVWERNVTGRGATVAIVDDGLEWTNPDIRPNYSAEGSWDLNSEDADPMPSGNKAQNHHGTRCAGEVAAAANRFCGVGVAYEAKVSGIRILDGPMTDSMEAAGFNKKMQINDVYSCSWGPDDDGVTVDGPHILAKKAMHYGIDFGRHGYGSIYVVASGNGGQHHDNCNYDGYANSIYTLTVGAIDETGQMPYYGEECASMLAVTFSSGGSGMRSIVTTDWRKDGGTGCTAGHTGTSAAAPLAAGMIALMLQVRPCLTWRDVQFLIVLTALKVDINIGNWQKNGAGLHHSLQHGFGVMKAWRLVNAAKVWETVPWMTSFSSRLFTPDVTIPKNLHPLVVRHNVTAAMLLGYELKTLEQVQVIVTISHWRRGNLEVRLTCPSGTHSILGATRPKDRSGEGLNGWVFSTVRCWGEQPLGEWILQISDTGKSSSPEGKLQKWQLRMFGSPMTRQEFDARKSKVKEAMSGKFLNDSFSLPCRPPAVNPQPEKPVLSKKTLQILLLTGAFCLFMAFYETMEYALCYNEEKKEHKRLLSLSARAQRMVRQHNGVTYHQVSGEVDTAIDMEENSIPMTTIQQCPLMAGDSNDEDVLFSAERDTLQLPDLNCDIPKEIIESLSPDELRLNLNFQELCKEKCDKFTNDQEDDFNSQLVVNLPEQD